MTPAQLPASERARGQAQLFRRLIGVSAVLLLPGVPLLWYDRGPSAGLAFAAALAIALTGALLGLRRIEGVGRDERRERGDDGRS